MFRKLTKVAPFALAFAPMLALAQGLLQGDTGEAESLFEAAGSIVNWVVIFVIALAVLYFLMALLNYIRKAGDEKERSAARQSMIWGIVIIAVMVSVWGLVEFLQDTFGVDSGSTFQAPDIPGQADY